MRVPFFKLSSAVRECFEFIDTCGGMTDRILRITNLFFVPLCAIVHRVLE